MRTSIIFIIILLLSFSVLNGNVKYVKSMSNSKMEIVTLGAGCFWCVEAVFSRIKGVEKVESGYSGGKIANPTYREVCSGLTGHAEVVQVTFNPEIISFGKILEIYFKTHDPTTLNRQGGDVGTQYRSVIFYHNDEQRKVAIEVKEMLNKAGIWSDPIVTEISPFAAFYKAEDYHQDYFSNNKNQPYCQMVITPKVGKFEKHFKEYLKEK